MITPKYYETVLDLGVARLNFRIEMLGSFFFVRTASNVNANIDVKLNSPANPAINLTRFTGLICAFDSVYITNVVQANQTISVFISSDFNRLRYLALKTDVIIGYDNPHRLPIRHAHCVVAATEYNLVLSPWASGFMIKARGGPIQFCFVALGSGVDYILLADGQSFFIDDVRIGDPYTLYFQSANAGTVIELLEKLPY